MTPAVPDPTVEARLDRYLEARGIPLPKGTVKYVLGEAKELVEAHKIGDGWGVELELADVVLACAVLARQLGTTVEDCIAAKTEHDRGRGA